MRRLSEFKICQHMFNTKEEYYENYKHCYNEADYALSFSKKWFFSCKNHLISLIRDSDDKTFCFGNSYHSRIFIEQNDIQNIEYCTIDEYFILQKKIELLS